MPRGTRIAETRKERADWRRYKYEPRDWRLTIEDMREAARKRGGRCLSPHYRPGEPLLWECAKGHTWKALGTSVRGSYGNGGRWCSLCAYAARGMALRLPLKLLASIARQRGGRLLSNAYLPSSTKLEWRCKKGHEWFREGSAIKLGAWCPKCGGTTRLTIEEIASAASKRGGRCLSKRYEPKRKLLFECAQGHRWRTVGGAITQGHWCHRCMGSGGITLAEIRTSVGARGGRCLSTRYVPGQPVLVECSSGHQFETRAYQLNNGHWCPRCAGRKTLEDAQVLAASHGGRCLSKRYVPVPGLMTWRCAAGHVFERHFTDARLHWCPGCSRWRHLTTADMHAAARRHGGRFLSPEYRPYPHRLEWECAKGHRWKAVGSGVHRGSWCRACLGFGATIADLQKLVQPRGGKVLSTVYRSRPFKLRFMCAAGHRWETTGFAIRQGRWCPHCAGNARLTIEHMYKIARERGGRCLSRRYVPSEKLRWRCAKGHEWSQLGRVVNRGHWCIHCRHRSDATT